MLWRYDKRRANQSDFIYYGERPVASDSAEASVLIPYALSVLTALGVLSGPVHMEIMLTATTNDGDGGVGLLSPCLIEANLRCHGGSGLWAPLAERLYPGGHTQVTMAVDAALDPPQRFASLPERCGRESFRGKAEPPPEPQGSRGPGRQRPIHKPYGSGRRQGGDVQPV